MSNESDSSLTRARGKAREAMDLAEAERRRALFRKRLELAREGVRAYLDLKNPAEAVLKFKTYLRILEEWKHVQEGGLTPEVFDDSNEDAAELLLLCGVYWDLTKIFDKTDSDEKYREFQGFLDKFVMFSKGQRFQIVSIETMRRYIAQGKPYHKAEFKRAFKVLDDGRCFVAGSLSDLLKPQVIPNLRDFRDRGLKGFSLGRAFVAFYYKNGPRWAGWMNRAPRLVRVIAAGALSLLSEGWSRFARGARSSRE